MTSTGPHGPHRAPRPPSLTHLKPELHGALEQLMHFMWALQKIIISATNDETRGFRTLGQATFYPEHCEVPQVTPMDAAVNLAHKSTHAKIRTLNGKHNLLTGRHATALEDLAGIFMQEATRDMQPQPSQQQTSTNPTAPQQIQQAPQRHQRINRIQQIVGSMLFYARSVDLTNLPGLNTLASEQTTATETTMDNIKVMLDY